MYSLRILGILGNLTTITLLGIECTVWNINHQTSEQEGPDIIYSKTLLLQMKKQKSRRLTDLLKVVFFWGGSGLYSFLGATITTYPKWDGLPQKFIVLEARSPKRRCHRAGAFWGLWRRICSMPNSGLLAAADIPWFVDGFLPVSSHGLPCVCDCVQISPLYMETSHIGLWLTLMTSCKLNYLFTDPILK